MSDLLTIFCCVAMVLGFIEGVFRLLDVLDLPLFEPAPRYGYLMRPNQWVSPRGQRIQINGHGLRGPDFEMPKPPNVYRIAFWGDSMIYGGGCIAEQDLFVRIVERNLTVRLNRQVQAINVSAPGWGIPNIAEYSQVQGLLDADLVLWILPEVDFRRPLTSLDTYPGFPLRKSWLRSVALLKVRSARLVKGFRRRSSPTPNRSETLADNLEVFKRTLDSVTRQGVAIAVILSPHEGGFSRPDHAELFHNAAAGRGLNTLDISSTLLDHPEYFFDGAHFSTVGHRMVADRITDFVLETGFSSGRSRDPIPS